MDDGRRSGTSERDAIGRPLALSTSCNQIIRAKVKSCDCVGVEKFQLAGTYAIPKGVVISRTFL